MIGGVCTARSEALSDLTKDFSLVLGGPIYRFMVRVGLVKPALDRVAWRIVVITLFAWAPPFVLSALAGRLTGGVAIPFLHDFEVHTRLLAALPLLIYAEVTVHRWVRPLLRQFVDRQVVGPSTLRRYEQCIHSAGRLADSTIVEIGLLAVVFIVGNLWWKSTTIWSSSTWFAVRTGGQQVLTPAGYWYEFVSLPVVQFIALRWYFRLFVWTRLLWQVSRLDLTLVATHPDARCGLGFLGNMIGLSPFLMAHSVALSGYLADRIVYEGTKLPDYGPDIFAITLFLCAVALGPVCVFVPRLFRERWRGLRTYGTLASEYVIAFDEKWVQRERVPGEPLVGSADIQSLADMGNSFSVVQRIRAFPFGQDILIWLALVIVLPLLPLVLTMFSLREIAARLVHAML